MFEDIKQFLNWDYCRSCQGCCAYSEKESVWSARVTPSEAEELGRVSGQGKDILSRPGCLKLVPDEAKGHRCLFLDRKEYKCTVYASRPDECRLYPFVLSSEKDGVKLHAHLSCPFIQDKMGSVEWNDYVATLRAFFSSAEARQYTAEHKNLFPDYSTFRDQIVPVASVRSSFPSTLMREKARFDKASASSGPALSARAFANLFIWQDAFDFEFEEIEGQLCVYARQPVGSFLYLPPLGPKVSLDAVRQVFVRLRAMNNGGSMTRIENVSRRECEDLDPARFVCAERGPEYFYLRTEIAALNGHALKSKRHDVHLVERDGSAVFRAYHPSDRAACGRLFERWLDRKLGTLDDGTDLMPRQMLADADHVHHKLWDHAGALGLEGRVVEIDDRVVAYTFGVRLNDETFCILAEVTDPKVAGLAAYVFRAFADDPAVRLFQYLNTMDDYGLPALSQAKMSWRPALLEPVFTVTEKGN